MEKVKNVKLLIQEMLNLLEKRQVEGAVNINGAEAIKAVKSRKIKILKMIA